MIEKLQVRKEFKPGIPLALFKLPDNKELMHKLNEVIDLANSHQENFEKLAQRFPVSTPKPAPLTPFTLDALKKYLASQLPYSATFSEVREAIERFENGER